MRVSYACFTALVRDRAAVLMLSSSAMPSTAATHDALQFIFVDEYKGCSTKGSQPLPNTLIMQH